MLVAIGNILGLRLHLDGDTSYARSRLQHRPAGALSEALLPASGISSLAKSLRTITYFHSVVLKWTLLPAGQ